MSLFESASLVVTPNGIKASKLYAIKPTDGSGDLSVVRATSATRVDANGLIEIPRTNLTQRSEDFSNGYWVKTNSDITSNTTIAPDGNLTADTFSDRVLTSQTYPIARNQSYTSGTTYTSSFFAKNLDRRYVYMRFVSSVFGTNKYAFFDLQLGTVISVSSGVTAEIIDYGNGWFRCIATSTASVTTSTVNGIFIGLSDNGVNVSYTNPSVKSIYLWGTQLEVGNSATEYIPTTSVIRTKFAGITQDGSSALNIPRLDYSNGSCPSILVEPQRTNLAKYSDDFSNATWAKTRCTVISNATTAPDGTLTADKLILSVDNNTHFIQQSGIAVTAQIYSATVYAKKAEYDTVRILLANYWSPSPNVIFNLTTKSIVSTASATAKITELTNGWFKLDITATINAAAGGNAYFAIYGGNNGIINLVGDGTSGVYIWGAQLEAGSYATSYIPTTSASVTRNANVISKTGISSLIGQTEGTMFVDLKALFDSQNRRAITLNDGTSQNNIIVRYSTVSNQIDYLVYSGNVLQVNMSKIVSDITSQNKIIVTYKNNECKLFVNGQLINTDTSATMPTSLTKLSFDNGGNTNYFEGKLNNLVLWKTALTEQECINLTTI